MYLNLEKLISNWDKMNCINETEHNLFITTKRH